MVYAHHRILVCNKKEQSIDTSNNLDGSWGHYADWKKTISKGHIVYDCIYITVSERQNCSDGEQIRACEELGMMEVKKIGETIRQVGLGKSLWWWGSCVSWLCRRLQQSTHDKMA